MTNNLHKNVQGDKISLENWRTHPYNRIAFSKVDNILPYEVIHKGTKEARIVQGYDSSDSADVREDYLEFYERELINHQFMVFRALESLFQNFQFLIKICI